MKDKIFVSHSSVWKDSFVIPLVNKLGRDWVIVDKYNFESGEEIFEEIKKGINECRYFLFLISKEALVEGGWVDREIGYVLERVVNGDILFWPVIIDSEIEWNDCRIKPWIRNRYIVDKIPTPELLSHILRRKIRRDFFDREKSSNIGYRLFMGRDKEISRLKGKLRDAELDYDSPNPNTIIVSGMRHLGRKRFLQEFLSLEVKTGILPEDILLVHLDSTDDEWAFLQKINNIVGKYSPAQIDKMFTDKDRIFDLIVEMLSLMRDSKLPIIIEDDGAIVKRDGSIVGWLFRLTKLSAFQGELLFNIVSRFRPRSELSDKFPWMLTTSLYEIPKEWLSRIMKKYAQICEVGVNEITVEECVEKAAGYPRPVYVFVDAIKNGANKRKVYRGALKSCLDTIESNFNGVIEELKKYAPQAFPTVQILSKAPFLSESNLCAIVGDEVYDYLDILDSYMILENSGRENSLVSINSGLADYVRRRESEMPKELEQRFKEYAASRLANLESEDTDLGGYLIAQREAIKDNVTSIPPENLIPSVVLKLMTECYYQKDNKSVICMADQLLKSYKMKYAELDRPVHYWLCSALCREADPRAKREIMYFDVNSYSYNFLMGFFYRHNIKKMSVVNAYKNAKEYYLKAYNFIGKNDSEFDDAKLFHELWMIKFELGESDALEFAERCYKRRPSNPFHIESYFRSMVRSKNPDIDKLDSLIEKMKCSADTDRYIISDTMKIEKDFYVMNRNFQKFVKDIQSILDTCDREHEISYPLRILREICEGHDAMSTFLSIKRKYKAIDSEMKCRLPD